MRRFLTVAIIFMATPASAVCTDGFFSCLSQNIPLTTGNTVVHSTNKNSAHVNEGGIKGLVDTYADRYGIPRHIAHGVVKVESGYNCAARNSSGARGIGQVFPATARSVGVTGNLLDCATGLRASMLYLKLALNAGGTGCAGISLYNRGIFAFPKCTSYGRMVLRNNVTY